MANVVNKPDSVKVVAQILWSALESAAKAVDRDDGASQLFLEELSDELKPSLKWALRYGVWPDFESEDTDPGHDLDFDEEP